MTFILIVILLLILFGIYKRNTKSKSSNSSINYVDPVSLKWIQFIAHYRKIAKTKSQKEIIDQMFDNLSAQGYTIPPDILADDLPQADEENKLIPESLNLNQTPNLSSNQNVNTSTEPSINTAQIQLDNTSLILYFGAFLFVASAGLFVVFASLPGIARSLIVFITTLMMYCGGVWLYKKNPKLKQAGLTFAGIGIATAPLIGLAMYSYVLNKSHGPEIWFCTSILCLLLYTHALFKLRKPLINYVFILTFLSLFESGVSIIHAPLYYFGWMLAAIGIVLMAISKLKGFWPELQESSRLSGKLFLPLSVLVSIALVPNHGIGQLGVSLLLASAYYGLETLNTIGTLQNSNAIVSQFLLQIGTSSLVYSHFKTFQSIAISLLVLVFFQTLLVLKFSKSSLLAKDFASISLLSGITAVIVNWKDPKVMLISSIVLSIVSVAIWLRQNRVDAYILAMSTLLISTVIYGHSFSQPHITYSFQSILLLIALLPQFLILYFVKKKNINKHDLRDMNIAFIISSVAVIASSYLASSEISLIVSCLVTLLSLLLLSRQKYINLSVAAGLFIAGPLLWTWKDANIFLTSLIVAILLNLVLSLRYRKELNRWFSTILWLLLPLGLGNIHFITLWNRYWYAVAYLIIMLVLIASRSIARGVILISSKIPMASYAHNASMSYVVGYTISTILSISLSASGGKSYVTSFILCVVTFSVWLLSNRVEKQPELNLLIPLLIQGILLSIIYPHYQDKSMLVFTLLSSLIAVMSYFIAQSLTNIQVRTAGQYGALIAVFITPFSGLLTQQQQIWTMPYGLLVAGLLVFYAVRDSKQEYKELAGGLIVLGLFWVLHFYGVRNIQVYSHMLAILFAIYAYWRFKRREVHLSDNYTIAMLVTASVPLALQALSGHSGGLYGWWLIIEEVAIMLIGMSIGKRLITLWGLYVAAGAVLYQLRGLGWAALAFLAVFIIGVAIYSLQKHSDK